MTSHRVLVVGGGVAGLSLNLALNLALGNERWQVELVERDPAGNRLGAGLAVQPNAMRALRQLGVADRVEKAGAVLHRFQYRDQHGTLLCDVDLDQVWDGVGPFVGVARTALHEALRPDPERWRTGVSVGAVRHGDGYASVSFDDGTTEAYDLVVGADGVNSTVRRFVTDHPEPVYSGQMAWRSIAPTRPAGLDGVQFWLGADRFFGLCPVGGDATYGFGNLAGSPVHEPVAGRRQRLAERFAGFGSPVQEYLAAVERDSDVHCGPVEWLPSVAWYDRRVVLVGDAAHAMSPMMGQGGGMAVEDALVLADELRRAVDIDEGLAAFAARRMARVQWVRQQSEALGELVRLPAQVRDRALRERGAASFQERYRPLVAEP
jgi:2-polyprenyl-6-methoxyphenol hydroxylase-like FAD-dependent oxidoreductase